ncbi:MAG: DUF4838 domain-containing protein [Kiritimatiellia bacterium]
MSKSVLTVLNVLFLAGACAAADVTVCAGWQIVVPEPDDTGVTAAIGTAARRLARAFAENGVGLLPVVTPGRKSAAPAIYLGAAAAERAGLMTKDVRDFANVIAEKDGGVYLFGRDRSGRPGRKNADWRLCVLPTVRAVARFMESRMDVRFLCPGEIGTDVPKGVAVTVPSGLRDFELPPVDYAGANVDDPLHSYANGIFGSGLYHSYGGHSYPVACPASKLFKSHPEYFALVRGRRAVSPHGDGQTALCLSNPAVRKLILEEALRRFDEGATVVQVAQQDGCSACECEACAHFLGTEPGDWKEKYWRFHMALARKVAELRPGKRVLLPAYGATSKPPDELSKLPSNVIIEQTSSTDRSFAEWRTAGYGGEFTAYIYLWGCYPAMGACPKRSFATCASLARRLRRNRVRGVYRCGYGELYGMEGPAYWVFNRVLLDPARKTEDLVDEYCRRMYGPASGPMREFFRIMDVRLTAVNCFDGSDTTVDEGRFFEPMKRHVSFAKSPMDVVAFAFAPETVMQLELRLREAEQKAKDARLKARLALVRYEFEYVKATAAVAQLQAAYLAAPGEMTAEACARAYSRRFARIDDIVGRARHAGSTDYRFDLWPDVRLYGGWSREQLEDNGRMSAGWRLQMRWMLMYLRDDGLLPGARIGFGDRAATAEPADVGSALVFANESELRATGSVQLPAMAALAPGRDYRLSWWVKVDACRPLVPYGGFYFTVAGGRWRSDVPKAWDERMVGRSGWIRQTFDFTAEQGRPPRMTWTFHNAQGSVRLANVACEAIRPGQGGTPPEKRQ